MLSPIKTKVQLNDLLKHGIDINDNIEMAQYHLNEINNATNKVLQLLDELIS